jgi:hypothetical protein
VVGGPGTRPASRGRGAVSRGTGTLDPSRTANHKGLFKPALFASWIREECGLGGPTSWPNASSQREVMERSPYEVKAIWIDGGGEYMEEFAEACREVGLRRCTCYRGPVQDGMGAWSGRVKC